MYFVRCGEACVCVCVCVCVSESKSESQGGVFASKYRIQTLRRNVESSNFCVWDVFYSSLPTQTFLLFIQS